MRVRIGRPAWAIQLLRLIFLGAADLKDDLEAAGPTDSLVSLYEFDVSAPKKNTIAGVSDAVFDKATPIPGVDSSDKGQVFVERAGNVKLYPNVPKRGNERSNTWSMLIDVKFSEMGKFTALYQTSLTNDDDGEGWLKNTDQMYIGIGIHSYIGVEVRDDYYFRFVIVADLPNNVKYFVNGRLVNDRIGACTSCNIDGRFSLQDEVLMVTDNDGEEAPADLTTVAFWSEALTNEQVFKLGGPSFGTADAPMCATVDELGSYLRDGLFKLDLSNPTDGVTKCGSMCCRGTATKPCSTWDARFGVDQTSGNCELLTSRSVCSSSHTNNVPNTQMDWYGYFCTPHYSVTPPLMEPLIVFLGGSEPESHFPSAGAYYAAVKAFFAGLVINASDIHPAMKDIFFASIGSQTAKGSPEPFSLTQQVTYELVYANRDEIRAAALASADSGAATVVSPKGTHFRVATIEDVGTLFRSQRKIPIPLAVVAGDGIEFCGAVSRSVMQGGYTAMMASGCAGASMKPKVRTVHSGSAAICSTWKNLFREIGVHKFGILWSKSWISSMYYEELSNLALASCMPRCTGRLEGSNTSICLSEMKEACAKETPSSTCEDTKDALKKMKDAQVRVIVVGLDSQTGEFSDFSDAVDELGMHGPQYLWLLISDTSSTMTSPKMTGMQIAQFGDRFDGALAVVNSCDGPMWTKFSAFLNDLTVQDFPPTMNLGADKTIAGGATYGVLFHLQGELARYFWYFKESVDAMIARAVDATWALLLAINEFVKEFGHAPYALPPAALIAQVNKQSFEGVCGSSISWNAGGERASATPMRIYNFRKVDETYENQRNKGNFFNFVSDALGVVTEQGATMSRSPRYFNGSTDVPPHVPPDCMPGEEALDDLLCHKCPLGRSEPSGGRGRKCAGCQDGYAAATRGQSYCDPCPPGKASNFDKSLCVDCPPGKIGKAGGCRNCTSGQYSPTLGLARCLQCEMGKYSTSPGAGNCTECPADDLTTKYPGSNTADDCGCREGLYADGESCKQCPTGMKCTFGASAKAGASVYPLLKPNYWSDPDKPLSVFRCENEDRCPGGDPGTCGPNLEGISCAHCKEDYVWNGEECLKCADVETTSLLFPILPVLLFPIVVCILYKLFGDEYNRWGSWQNGLAALFFIILNHYQIISLSRGAAVSFPVDVAGVWDSVLFTSDASTIFKTDCAGYADFKSSMIMKSISPAAMAIMFLIVFAGSIPVSKILRKDFLQMKRDRTLNAFFGLMFTFFAGIVGMAFTIFKCVPNPNDTKTLAIDRSIICNEADWNGMLVIGLLSVLFWCVGFGAVFVRAVIKAPHSFYDNGFQMRWKFLFIKFRPDVYWFALVLVCKGVFLNLGFIFLDTGVAQIYWMMLLIQVYLGATISFRPWRHMAINGFDIYAHFALTLALSALTWFAKNDLEDLSNLDKDMSNMVIAFSFVVFPMVIPVVWQILYTRLSAQHELLNKKRAILIQKAILKLALLENFQEWYMGLSEWDFWFMKEAATIITTELVGVRLNLGRCTTKQLKDRVGWVNETAPKVVLSSEAAPAPVPEVTGTKIEEREVNGGNGGNGNRNEEKVALQNAIVNLEMFEALNDIYQHQHYQVGPTVSIATPIQTPGRSPRELREVITPRSNGNITPNDVPRSPRGFSPR